MSSPVEPISYNPEAAAAAVGVSEKLIRNAVNAGELKAKRTGKTNEAGKKTGRIIIMRDELLAWLKRLEDAS